MKNEKSDNKKSIKNNSMAIGGKSPVPVQKKKDAPEEFSENRSTAVRMKPQPAKKSDKKTPVKKGK